MGSPGGNNSNNERVPPPAEGRSQTPDNLYQNSLERLQGGPGGSDFAPITDQLINKPEGNFELAARAHGIESHLAQGHGAVTNMTFKVQEGDGKTRDISGPVSFDSRGQQFMVDKETNQMFRVMPPREGESGQGSLQAMNGRRSAGGEVMPVVHQQTSEPFAGRQGGRSQGGENFNVGGQESRARDSRPAAESARQDDRGRESRPAVESARQDDRGRESRPAVESARHDDRGRDSRAAAESVRQDDRSRESRPAVESARHDDRGRDSRPAAESVRQDDRGRESRQPAEQTRQDDRVRESHEPKTETGRQEERTRESREQSEYVRQEDRNRYGDRESREQSEPARQDERSRYGDRESRDQQADSPEKNDRGRNTADASDSTERNRSERRTDVESTREQNASEQHEKSEKRDRETASTLDDKEKTKTKDDSLGLQSERERSDDRTRTSKDNAGDDTPKDAEKDKTKPELSEKLDAALKDKQLAPAMKDLVEQIQKGKQDQELQQNRKLDDVMKALGPEGLADLRRALADKENLISKQLEGRLEQKSDTKFDTTISPRLKDMMESFNGQGNKQNEQKLNPGTLVSERMLDILKQNENTIARVPEPASQQKIFAELDRFVKDLNNDASKNLTLKDVLNRSFEDQAQRQNNQNQLNANQLNNVDRRDFVIRPYGLDDQAIRLVLDRLHAHNQAANAQQQAIAVRPHEQDPQRKQDAALRNNEQARVEPKFDPRVEYKPEIAARPEDRPSREQVSRAETNVPVRPDVQPVAGRTERPSDVSSELTAQTKADALAANKANAERDERLREEDERKRRELKLKEEKEKKEEEEEKLRKKEEDAKIQAAALAAALAAKQRKLEEEEKKKETADEKDKKEPEQRVKYIVKKGDTLESIAMRMLRDKRLSGLIYDINKDKIPVVMVAGKKVPRLQEGMAIWLPTPTESKEYRVRLMSPQQTPRAPQEKKLTPEEELAARFGKGPDDSFGELSQEMDDAARAAYQARRKHVESMLGPLSQKNESSTPKHLVRLGETLKSIAMKHPALQDVGLWKLLAEINGLSTAVDEKGTPIARISRGQSILLPTAADIAAFRQREKGEVTTQSSSGVELPKRACPKCQRVTFASASLCPGCGTVFNLLPPAAAPGAAPTATPAASARAAMPPAGPAPSPKGTLSAPKVVSPSEPASSKIKKSAPTIKSPPITRSSGYTPMNPDAGMTVIQEFSPTVRLAKLTSDKDASTRLCLEILESDKWITVMQYEIFATYCLKHAPGSAIAPQRMELSESKAIEAGISDFQKHWSDYSGKMKEDK